MITAKEQLAFAIARNFENSNTQLGIGVTSIKWFILVANHSMDKIPAKEKSTH
jgi:hypothetical protein